MTRIVWFRRDLRLADNPALAAACAGAEKLLCIYVHAPLEECPWQPGAASRWWLHHSLTALDDELRAIGQRLHVFEGASARVIENLCRAVDSSDVHAGALVEPAARRRDRAVRDQLARSGITLHRHAPNLLFEPGSVLAANGNPYRVFTPFWRQARTRLPAGLPESMPTLPPPPAAVPVALVIGELGLLPGQRWDKGLGENWQPGEQGAAAALADFLDGEVLRYEEARNRPDQPGTSRVSPHLHFGEISPRQVVLTLRQRGLLNRGEPFTREIGWREFCHHVLWHFPHTSDAPMVAGFASYPWLEPPDRELLTAWQQGRTGIPLVDAGMRELWATGWMHNRVRMVVASLLTKNLRTHWLHGARWFWDTLVDADLANNSAGWQWCAGSGADAAPYFRVFNPVLQGQRFDPRGDYVRRWIPELAHVPAAAIHSPWKLGPAQQRDFGIADSIYGSPLVDLVATRAAALEGFAAMRAGAVRDNRGDASVAGTIDSAANGGNDAGADCAAW